MMDLAAPQTTLAGVGADARPARRAAAALDAHALDLGVALRRAVPFLIRRGVPVAAVTARAASLAGVLAELQPPTYVLHLATDPGGSRAALVVDAVAAAFLIEGLLGGDGSKPPELHAQGLTGPQSVLVSRVAHRIAESFSAVLGAGAGFGFTRLPPTSAAPGDTALAALTLALGASGELGSITLLIAKEALLVGAATPTGRASLVDPRIEATLEEVELDLVVELGRVTLKLGALAALRVGDTLPIDCPIDGPVHVRVGDQTLLFGTPTTSGSRLAVRIVGRHGA